MEIVYQNEKETRGFEVITKRLEFIVKVEDKYVANVIEYWRGWFGTRCDSYSKSFDSIDEAHTYIGGMI